MTITYTAQVATSSFSCFLKLLARWRGSIYKLLWKDFIAFAFIFYALNFSYRFLMNDAQREIFEMIARYCEQNNTLIPVAFVLGFYVSLIMTRWWNQLGHIPWPDHMALYVTANVQGFDERGRLMRRTMLRYLNLAYAMTMASISPAVAKRFPTPHHMVEAGLMTQCEEEILAKIDTRHNKFFIPLGWTTSLVTRARLEQRIRDDFAVKTLIDEINTFRMHLATLFVYDMITVPLVYTQVVTIAVYMFFLACLMGRQFLNDKPGSPDVYFPIFTFLEYLFYMGWLKVAECFVNPFGEDEDDFDINRLIDRNLEVSYLIVDTMHDEHPDLIRDQYWDNVKFDIPYTVCSEQFRIKEPHLGSAIDLSKSYKDKDYLMSKTSLQLIEEQDESDQGTDIEQGEGSSPSKRAPRLSSSHQRSHKGSHPTRRQFSRLSEHRSGSPYAPGTHFGSVKDSSMPESPPTACTMYSPQFPETAASGRWGTTPPQLSPLSPQQNDPPTQFHMEGLENEEAAETDALLKREKPSEAFEMKPVFNRNASQSSGTADPASKDRGQSVSSENPPQARTSLSTVDELSPEIVEESVSPLKRQPLSLVMPKSTPATNDAPPVDTASSDFALEAAVDLHGKPDGTLKRFVAPPSNLMSPDIPPTPALTTPVWVKAPPLSVAPNQPQAPTHR